MSIVLHTLVILSGNSNAAARVINPARLGATVLACRPIFGANVARIEELASAIVLLFILRNILGSKIYCFGTQCALFEGVLSSSLEEQPKFVGDKGLNW
jgi:hypothetical protein